MSENLFLQKSIFSLKKFESFQTTPRKVKMLGFFSIKNVEDAKKAFIEDLFNFGKWMNFQSLIEEGLIVKNLSNCVG